MLLFCSWLNCYFLFRIGQGRYMLLTWFGFPSLWLEYYNLIPYLSSSNCICQFSSLPLSEISFCAHSKINTLEKLTASITIKKNYQPNWPTIQLLPTVAFHCATSSVMEWGSYLFSLYLPVETPISSARFISGFSLAGLLSCLFLSFFPRSVYPRIKQDALKFRIAQIQKICLNSQCHTCQVNSKF